MWGGLAHAMKIAGAVRSRQPRAYRDRRIRANALPPPYTKRSDISDRLRTRVGAVSNFEASASSSSRFDRDRRGHVADVSRASSSPEVITSPTRRR